MYAEQLQRLIPLLKVKEKDANQREVILNILNTQSSTRQIFERLGCTTQVEKLQVGGCNNKLCYYFTYQYSPRGAVVMKQNTKNDLKLFILLSGSVTSSE